MDPLQNRIQQIAAALRSQRVDRAEVSVPAGQAAAAKAAVSTLQEPAGNGTMELAQVIANRVRLLAVTDPQRRRKVFQVFLESVLSAEFGSVVASNPRFLAMVESVQAQIEADAELAPLVDSAVTTLLASCDGPA